MGLPWQGPSRSGYCATDDVAPSLKIVTEAVVCSLATSIAVALMTCVP